MNTPADQARAFAAAFEARKDRVNQRQSGDWTITLTLAGGVDLPKAILLAKPGTRYQVALVEIGDDELPKPTGDDLPGKQGQDAPKPETVVEAVQTPTDASGAVSTTRLPRAWQDMTLSAQAGIRCGEPEFQKWIGAKDAAEAAVKVRVNCGVDSRRRLNEGGDGATRWRAMDATYQRYTQMIALSQRFGDGQ